MTTQDLTCLHFPGRNYTPKENLKPGYTNWGNFSDKNADDPGFNFFPEWTTYQGYCHLTGQCEGSHCDCRPETLNNFGLADLGGAVWKGYGDCSGGRSWGCCGCAIMSWNQDPYNKSQCCDPAGSPIQGSAVHCETGWCPFSPQCLVDPVTITYCKTHPTDAKCLGTCMNYATSETHADAPVWCNAFIETYCQKKSDKGTKSVSEMSDADATICACLLNQTSSDECLWPQCTFSPDGQSWKTADQYKNIADPNYCTSKCKGIAASVVAKTGSINTSQYAQVCGNDPLPTPPGGGGGDGGGGDGSSFSFSSIQDWFQNLSVGEYAGIGVGVFILLVIIVRSMRSSKSLTSSPPP